MKISKLNFINEVPTMRNPFLKSYAENEKVTLSEADQKHQHNK